MARPDAEKRVHWTPDTYSRSTACGRFVAMSGPRAMHYGAAIKHSDDKAEVTCARCLAVMPREEPADDSVPAP